MILGERSVARHEVLGHDKAVQPTAQREPRRGGRGLNAMPTELIPAPRDIVAPTTAPEAERTT